MLTWRHPLLPPNSKRALLSANFQLKILNLKLEISHKVRLELGSLA